MRARPDRHLPGLRLRRLAVFGVGLIGASVGLAARKAGLADEVVGIGRRSESLRQALKVGAVDSFTTRLEEGLEGADMLVLCAPPGVVLSLLEGGVPGLGREALVTDACSTKQAVVEAAARALELPGRFVGAHPIAGSEKSGPGAAKEGLFRGRATVLTPTHLTFPEALSAVENFWSALGSRVFCLDAAEHDRILGLTSHLPHLLAAAATLMVSREEGEDVRRCLGSGFRDLTRVAAGEESMWRDIMLTNAGNLSGQLAKLSALLDQWRKLLENGDGRGVESLLAEAAEFQRCLRISSQGQGEEKENGRQENDG